ncbi:hypothetical protein NKH77_20025 [Streptomyces sp. M19]
MGDRRLPPVLRPGTTALFAAQAGLGGPDPRGVLKVTTFYNALLGGAVDTPYTSVSGPRRDPAAPDPPQSRAPVRAGPGDRDPRHPLVAARPPRRAPRGPRTPGPGPRFETTLSPAHGDVQEFLVALHATEAIELHISHERDRQVLRLLCDAPGVRDLLATALDALARPTPPRPGPPRTVPGPSGGHGHRPFAVHVELGGTRSERRTVAFRPGTRPVRGLAAREGRLAEAAPSSLSRSGRGPGTRLVEESPTFARAAGHRRVTLWTDANPASARRI